MTETTTTRRCAPRQAGWPAYILHPSFLRPGAERTWGRLPDDDHRAAGLGYMPDDETRDRTARMHYAAYRVNRAGTRRAAERWLQQYFQLRDSIVLGNMKLIFRAVRRSLAAQHSDDWIGECQIVLIQAVAAYNPWFGVRFSTYAYTCLARALSRLAQRCGADRLSQAFSLDTFTDGGPAESTADSATGGRPRIEEYLHAGHPLLSSREKAILMRRYFGDESRPIPTLEAVGRDIGLSKERVRQVQAGALAKLRSVLV